MSRITALTTRISLIALIGASLGAGALLTGCGAAATQETASHGGGATEAADHDTSGPARGSSASHDGQQRPRELAAEPAAEMEMTAEELAYDEGAAPAAPQPSLSVEAPSPSYGRSAGRERRLSAKAGAAPAMERWDHGGAHSTPPGPGYAPTDADFDTETYDRLQDNPFLAVADKPLSTFSIDVDTASYSNVRRMLRQGAKPPPGAVRIEELVNYFSYHYPEPEGERPFSVVTEVSKAPWNPEHRLVHVGLQGKSMAPDEAPPKNLVFLIDVSGSMNQPNKLPLLKRSMLQLLETLDEDDHVAIVVYAGASGVVLPPTPGSDRRTITQAIESLQPGGGTNGAAGIQLAYEAARRFRRGETVSRVILATDGDFNLGVTSQSELVRLVEHERQSGTDLTVLGFGMGNYKDSTLEKLADNGNGNYAYIDTDREAHKVLVEQTNATLVTIAQDVKIQLEFNPAKVGAYRLVGYENRMLRARDFNDDKKDAGEIGAGHSVTAIYEIAPPGSSLSSSGVDPLRYQSPRQRPGDSDSDELLTVKLRYKDPGGSKSKLARYAVADHTTPLARTSHAYRFSAAVAAFGMLLRESPHRGKASWQMVESLARKAQGSDPHGYRQEFLELVRLASGGGAPPPVRQWHSHGIAPGVPTPAPQPRATMRELEGLPRWEDARR